jgi:hypothetical protein
VGLDAAGIAVTPRAIDSSCSKRRGRIVVIDGFCARRAAAWRDRAAGESAELRGLAFDPVTAICTRSRPDG